MTARKTQQEEEGTRRAHGAERAEAKKVFDRFAETGSNFMGITLLDTGGSPVVSAIDKSLEDPCCRAL
jgi:hypothetical protein